MGKFRAAEYRYTDENQINMDDLTRWLVKSKEIQWDYKNIAKRQGLIESKQHMAVAPEGVGIDHFFNEIEQAGYDSTKGLMRIRWEKPVDYPLLDKIIEFNILDKAECTTFWRK